MSEYYVSLRHVHVACAILTIALFVFRGLLMMSESAVLQSRVLRYLPHFIDSVLLASALVLTTIIHQYPFANDWLTMKSVLLLVYILLGTVALKRGRTKTVRVTAFLGALLVIGFLLSVALARNPLGILTRPSQALGSRGFETSLVPPGGWPARVGRLQPVGRNFQYPRRRQEALGQIRIIDDGVVDRGIALQHDARRGTQNGGGVVDVVALGFDAGANRGIE